MPQPETPAARSGTIQGAAYSGSACNHASMPTPARSLYPQTHILHQPARVGPRQSSDKMMRAPHLNEDM